MLYCTFLSRQFERDNELYPLTSLPRVEMINCDLHDLTHDLHKFEISILSRFFAQK